MSKNSDRRGGQSAPSRPSARSRPWRPIVTLGAAVAILGAAISLAAPLVLSRGGAPKLVVDRTVIDFGDVGYGKLVTAEFTLSNAGDGPLRITDAPIVKVLKGC
jgi:hypothetical protein